ncbi:hypothetical protein IEN85_20040 [Pelagicoccus sp. NFK12]|uniref:DUF7305 domain-containing protein n=1 Tax=Pelagicoccus enzymogenes TaxID=2773457 RepID=A0A927FB19_9BACT|nr:pilus assembly PilX N-terminal domain-containing protein [Pelagicoccus enzymogenes]MBD5781802.1 hypothetical protein [Pelagicoccus enzymogenes]
MRQKTTSKRGSAMIGALIIAILAGAIGASILDSAFTEMKMSRRHMEQQHAVTLAEAGLEEGVRAMIAGDWTGWTSYGTYGYYKNITSVSNVVLSGISGNFSLGLGGRGRTGEIKVYVHADPSDPVIAAEASIFNRGAGSTISRQIRVDMESGSLFENGVVSRESTTFKGGNVLVDSYDSRLGGYTESSYVNRFANGTVATLAVLNDLLDIGNGAVRGYIATAGGTVDIGSQGTIHDYLGGPYPAKYKDMSRVTNDFYADLPDISAPSSTGYTNLGSITGTTTIGGAGTQGYIIDNITLSGGATLTIAGDVKLIVTGDVAVTGTGKIDIDNTASMEMYVDGNVKIAGNGMANGTGKAENALIFGMDSTDGNKSITLGGNAVLHAAVYAPAYDFTVNGGGADGHIHGAIVGYRITMNGGAQFHYDEALSDLKMGDNFTIESWRELKGVGELLPFHTPADLPSHF